MPTVNLFDRQEEDDRECERCVTSTQLTSMTVDNSEKLNSLIECKDPENNFQLSCRMYHDPIYITQQGNYLHHPNKLMIQCGNKTLAFSASSEKSLNEYNYLIVSVLKDYFHIEVSEKFRWRHIYETPHVNSKCDDLLISSIQHHDKYELEELIKIGVINKNNKIEYIDFYPSQVLKEIFVMYKKQIPSDVTFHLQNNPLIVYNIYCIDKTAKQIGLKHGSIICINNVDISNETFLISVQPATGNSFELNVGLNWDTFDIRCEINKTQNIPIQHQILTYNGSKLRDGFTLIHYKIKHDARINLNLEE